MTLCLALVSCGSSAKSGEAPFLAVLSAFPAELAALVERADIEERIAHDDLVLRVGTLGGVKVVLGMTGVGLINAEHTTRAVLERFPVTGVIVSGVAGASLRIGDVAVPDTWRLADGTSHRAHAAWLGLARGLTDDYLPLERCTVVPATDEAVCLPHEPEVVVGGVGVSDDSFGSNALPCQPGGDDVFGCDIALEEVAQSPDDVEPAVVDMETTAIAREASKLGLPFIAFRAVSDGAGDPLGLPGFPAQFFAYYRLAATNAAAATTAFLERLGDRDEP